MKYTIYRAHTNDKEIINITCSPYIDLTFLKERYGINRLEILTQGMGISYADYIMRSEDKGFKPMLKLLSRINKGTENLRLKSIERSMRQLKMSSLGRPQIVDNMGELPGEEDLSAVHDILKGKIMDFLELNEVINKKGLFFSSSLQDILQALYLMGKVHIYPSVLIEKPGKKIICKNCEKELLEEQLNDESKCPKCGKYMQLDEPLFAASYDEVDPVFVPVKFKEYKSLTFPQDRASMELCSFLRSQEDECLLWTVPGSEDNNITSRVIREVLNRGGRCAIALSCRSESVRYYSCIKDTFPNNNCKLIEGRNLKDTADITVCGFEDVKRYYKAFDLIILSEPSICLKKADKCLRYQVKRAVKKGGKVIYATSAPDYKAYERVSKEEVRLITVPLRSHGKLCPEPRIMTYKALSYENFFIPVEAMEFIAWSAGEGIRVHIIVPSAELIKLFRERLLEYGDINEKWIQGANPLILITTLPCMNMYIQEEENIIVFFADDKGIFDEKALISAAGLSGRINFHTTGEVLFVGAKESEEIYNAKQMIRFINKSAWEMGYLR